MKITISEIPQVIERIDNFKQLLSNKTKQFLEKLSDMGVKTAKAKFGQIQYDGDFSDLKVNCRWNNEHSLSIVFSSDAILFIEFGTGVYYSGGSNSHPLADEFGYERGGYGQGRGKRPHWLYRDRGNNHGTHSLQSTKNVNMRITRGNPANRIVYNTAKELREQIKKIAEEVFKFD